MNLIQIHKIINKFRFKYCRWNNNKIIKKLKIKLFKNRIKSNSCKFNLI